MHFTTTTNNNIGLVIVHSQAFIIHDSGFPNIYSTKYIANCMHLKFDHHHKIMYSINIY